MKMPITLVNYLRSIMVILHPSLKVKKTEKDSKSNLESLYINHTTTFLTISLYHLLKSKS